MESAENVQALRHICHITFAARAYSNPCKHLLWQSNLNIGDRIDMIDGVPVRGKSQRQLAGMITQCDTTCVA